MKTAWNFTLLYKSDKDPQIEKDAKAIERLCTAFEKKYKNNLKSITTPDKLLPIFLEYEKLESKLSKSDPTYYFHLKRELDSSDAYAEEMATKLSLRLTKASNKLIFFPLFLGKLPAIFQKKILSDKRFASYHYLLKITFENARHNLSEAEEKILALKSLPARSLWVSGAEKVLNKQEVVFKGMTYPINEAISLVIDLPTQKDRLALSQIVLTRLKSISDFAESEINAICNDKKINDELREYEHPYSSTILGNQNTEDEVMGLAHAVRESADIGHKFYSIKKKLLKLKEFHYVDRNAPLGKVTKKISFDKAVEMAKEIFASVHPSYADILTAYLKKGQIDVFPKKGKAGGAFCSSTHGRPVLVLLNHQDKLYDFFTLVHEMGHAIHAERSRTQPAHYEGYSIAVAEVASTLFESLAFDYLFERATKREQIIMLYDRIQRDISTIHRQIAFFDFELELHNKIREKGFVQNNEIASILTSHIKSYMGKDVIVDPLNGYGYLYISHIRSFFYVYTYAYGILIAKAIVKNYKKNKGYAKQIDHFLTLGESMSPEAIFASIGIHTKNGTVFSDGLSSMREDVVRLETLAKEEGML